MSKDQKAFWIPAGIVAIILYLIGSFFPTETRSNNYYNERPPANCGRVSCD